MVATPFINPNKTTPIITIHTIILFLVFIISPTSNLKVMVTFLFVASSLISHPIGRASLGVYDSLNNLQV